MRTPLMGATVALAFAGAAAAHPDLPREDWCNAGKVAFVADFKLSGADIAGTCTADGDDGPVKPRAGSKRATPAPNHCGQFDPPYSAAKVAAGGHCANYGLPAHAGQDFGTTAAIVSGPETYLSPAHHEIYKLEQGVWGMCAICLPPGPVEPAQPVVKPQP